MLQILIRVMSLRQPSDLRLRAGVVRGVAGGVARPWRWDDAEEAHRLHHGQRAPGVLRRQDAAGEDELQEEARVWTHLIGQQIQG